MSKNYPVLCGGTFFTLLLNARSGKTPNQIYCFNGLMKIIDPSYVDISEDSKRIPSQFKNCALNGTSSYISFGDERIIQLFEKRIRKDYEDVICEFARFIDKVIGQGDKKMLISALLEIICKDNSIPDNAKLFINKGFEPSYKSEIVKSDSFLFYNFLLGIWFYIFSNRIDESKGKDTIEEWTDKNGTFRSEIGTWLYEEISIDYDYKNDNTIEDTIDSSKTRIDILIDTYLKNARQKHSKIVTFLYKNEEDFESFFVCSHLGIQVVGSGLGDKAKFHTIIEDFNVTKIPDNKNRVIIRGTAGLGKTMMMNHLFLDTIDRYKSDKHIPIFITLRDFDPRDGQLMDFLYSEFSRFNQELKLPDLGYVLSSGQAVLLMDGLDELSGESRRVFDKELERIMDLYPMTIYIISMRPGENTLFTGRFFKYELLPLEPTQAIELILKLDERYISNKIKMQFLDDIDNDRFGLTENEFKIFLGIPLFLCITLKTYTNYMDIPKKRYEFYDKAYEALCEGHDRIKSLRRAFNTGLNSSEFKMFFAEFCARSYIDSRVSFSDTELKEYYEKTINLYDYDFSFSNFLLDVTERVCLMFLDGDRYYFVHRSFQEYFAAYFFSRQPEDTFSTICNTFIIGKEGESSEDVTLEMLNGLNPYMVEKYIVLPYLKQTVSEDSMYSAFLEDKYGIIKYMYSEPDTGLHMNNTPKGRILSFICDNYKITYSILLKRIVNYMHPHVKSQPVYLIEDDKTNISQLVPEKELTLEQLEEFKEFGPTAYECFIHIKELDYNNKCDSAIFNILQSDDFPIKTQFNELRNLYNGLIEKYSRTVSSDDPFSIFHR